MFISNAYAQSASTGFSLDSIGGYWPILLMFVVLYFLMIRPQQKKQRQQRDMLSSLAVGDEVLTAGGIIGKVNKVADNHLFLGLSSGAELIIQKTSIVASLPRGTVDSLIAESSESAEPSEPAQIPATEDVAQPTTESTENKE